MLSAYAADQLTIDAEFIRHVIEQMMSVPHSRASTRTESHHAHPAPTAPTARETYDGSGAHVEQAHADGSTSSRHDTRDRSAQDSRELVEAREQLHRSVQRAQEMENDLRALLERAKMAEAHVAPNLEQLQQLTILVRRLLSETRCATEEAREVIASAQLAKTETRKAVTQLAEQSARTGRLTVTLREIVSRLEARADGLAESLRAKKQAAASSADKPERMFERTRHLDRVIQESRASADEVETLIAATSVARADSPRASEKRNEKPNGLNLEKSPVGELAIQVNALAKFIDETRTPVHA
jgi:DNA repair exonuclease SbcCD ATPase subunit